MRLTRRAFCAAILLLTSDVARTDEAARAFLAQIYGAFEGPDSKGLDFRDVRNARRYFTRGTAALIAKDAKDAERRGEVGRLDFDPFIVGNDWELRDLQITVSPAGRDKATGVASFMNLRKSTVVTFDLVRVPSGWRIADMHWEDGDSLRKRLMGR
jgi:hypothetical protein